MFSTDLQGIKYLLISLVFLAISCGMTILLFNLQSLDIPQGEQERELNYYMEPHNYVPEIKRLKADGKLHEALALAQYVVNNPDIPGYEEAKQLEQELASEIKNMQEQDDQLEAKLNSNNNESIITGLIKGFALGKTDTWTERFSALASDLFIWGDIRDLSIQTYNKIMGYEVNPIVAFFAGAGLLTQFSPFTDYITATTKEFAKIAMKTGVFSEKLATKFGKLAAKQKDMIKEILEKLTDKIGIARSVRVMKYVDLVDDLPALAKIIEKSPDTAYTMVKKGGKEGVDILKTLGKSDEGIKIMEDAIKSGLIDKIGFGRTKIFLSKVDTLSEFSTLTKIAEKNPDTAFQMLRLGGKEGLITMNILGQSREGIQMLNRAVKSGPLGMQWLKQGGKYKKSVPMVVYGIRYGARIAKNIEKIEKSNLAQNQNVQIVNTHTESAIASDTRQKNPLNHPLNGLFELLSYCWIEFPLFRKIYYLGLYIIILINFYYLIKSVIFLYPLLPLEIIYKKYKTEPVLSI